MPKQEQGAAEGAKADPSPLMKAAQEMMAAEDAAAKRDDAADQGDDAGDTAPPPAKQEAAKPEKKPAEKKEEDAGAKAAAERAEEDAAAKDDPKVRRGMDLVARRSKFENEKLDAARAKLESERKVAEPHLAVIRELGDKAPTALALAKAILAAGDDEIAILRAAGKTDLGAAAKKLATYALGKDAPADMKLEALKAEQEARIQRLEAEIKSRDERDAAARAEAENTAALGEYRKTLTAAVDGADAAAFPVMKVLGSKAVDGLLAFQRRHHAETGDLLAHDDLLPLYEEALVEEYGPEYVEWAKARATKKDPAPGKKAAPTKKHPTTADDEQAAETLNERDAAASTRPRKGAKTDEELEAEAVERLKARRQERESQRASRR